MRRRDLLAVACSPSLAVAGCTTEQDRSTEQDRTCTDVSITHASADIDYWCDTGSGIHGVVHVYTEDCDDELTLEIVNEGEVIREFDIDPSPLGTSEVEITTDAAAFDYEGATVNVRGPDGELHADRELSVSSYLDSPDLSVAAASFEPETVAAGEPVTVTFGVSTFGGEAEFEATLLVEDEPVETREGSIDGGADCGGFSGPEYEFTHTFADPGEYDLTGEIVVEGSPGAGDREPIGTVAVG
ncbi:hypothetical protein [Halorubrum sp. F4]|uniref:hypothetical protein n=1 Tax=Halorubrum sp. F4 TaxID=2989715 RepID=UPI002480948F|nr:hypothetical protein [Halorubrum sp. F4]